MLFLALAVMGELVKPVDITARAYNPDVVILHGEVTQFRLKLLDGLRLHFITQTAKRTYIIGVALGQLAIVDKRDLGRASAHVDVGEVAHVAVCLFQQVVIEQMGFLLSLDDVENDACFLLYLSQYLFAILGITHGRSGASPIAHHAVELHELLKALEHVEHHALSFL